MVRRERKAAENVGQSVRGKLQDIENYTPTGSTVMQPLLSRCCCFSLITGAVLTGVYSTAVYIVAFAMELWLIIEATEPLPSPPYVLSVIYFITWIMSVAFLVGLALRRTQPILAWLLCVGFVFFPECGLIMFMSLYYWTLGTSFGTVELVFWIVRASLNILGSIQVFSLYSQWKEEKTVSRRLRDLSMHATPLSNGYYTNAVIKTPLPGSLRAGYQNAAYLSSNLNLGQYGHQHHHQQQRQHKINPMDRNFMTTDRIHHSLQRSVSSLSRLEHDIEDNRRLSKSISKEDILNGFSLFDQWQQQRIERAKLGLVSEPGMAFGSMGIAGVGLDDSQSLGGRPMWFVDDGDYLNRAPLSRAVSTLLVNHYPSNFAVPTFDRQSQFLVGSGTRRIPVMRRAHSMSDLKPSAISPDIKFGRLDRQPFDYIRSAGQHVLVRGESDEFHRSYKDVAL